MVLNITLLCLKLSSVHELGLLSKSSLSEKLAKLVMQEKLATTIPLNQNSVIELIT